MSYQPIQGGMRMSGGQVSQGSSIAGSLGMRNSWDKRSSGSSAVSGRDSRGSRGSTEGLRMSGGPEMAGVGIFFQQEPSSGRVYVANIVEGGSADRSGVIRVNDVIVKVDDEDVQGQPLSTLRNLILGKQGTYVVLAFRRMTGTELYYFDVELVRGTPEYFEGLKKSQAIQDEKEKLLMQVRQQEKDIMALRGLTSAPVPPDVDGVRFEIASVTEQIGRVDRALQAERKVQEGANKDRSGAEQQLIALRQENAQLNTQLVSVSDQLETSKMRYQMALQSWQATKLNLEGEVDLHLAPPAAQQQARGSARELEEEKARARTWVAESDKREEAYKVKLAASLAALHDVLKQNEANVELLRDIAPALDTAHTQLFTTFGVGPSTTKT